MFRIECWYDFDMIDGGGIGSRAVVLARLLKYSVGT